MLGLLRAVGREDAELGRRKLALVGRAIREGAFDSRGVGAVQGLADLLGLDRVEAARLVRVAAQLCARRSLLGETLPPKFPALAAAVDSGAIDLSRARAALGPLTSAAADRIGAELLAEAERAVVAHAHDDHPTPGELRRYARELIDRLDQDGPEPAEPQQRHELWLYRDPDGGGSVKATLDAAGFAAVTTALDALSALGADDHRSTQRRRADALVELAEFSLSQRPDVPGAGGERPQVQVVMRLEDLRRRAGGSLVDSGGSLTAAQLRRLLCDCGVVPHVLGGTGQPLDIGRASRVIPASVRRSVTLRDRGCAFPGCTRTPRRCECHHIVPWSHGGPTAVDNLLLLCPFHHKLVHTSSWSVRMRDGTPEFIPPQWVDPSQVPRRKPRAV